METELMYWLLEYGKVLLAYIFLMFLWPSIMFRKYLKDKSWTYRFGFCTTAQVIISNTVILGLGLLHILNAWVVRILFYGALIFVAGRFIWNNKEKVDYVRRLMQGVYSFKQFCQECAIYLGSILKKSAIGFWSKFKKNKVEYVILILVILYGMLYFSYGAFQAHSYGCSDLAVHHSWIQGLIDGKVFSAGVYPFAMHCFIYTMYALFGVEVYSCLLLLAGIHVATFLIAVYCFLKEIFLWRFSALVVLILFLTVGLESVYQVIGMCRLQWTLPQEFGFFAMFLCALYLFKYLKKEKSDGFKDENLRMFMLSLIATIIIHFYSTIIAFFLCLAIVICYLWKIIKRKYFIPLSVSCVLSIVIAFLPMIAALLVGIKFQGSIGWGLNIIKGIVTEEGRSQKVEETPIDDHKENEDESAIDGLIFNDVDGNAWKYVNGEMVRWDELVDSDEGVENKEIVENEVLEKQDTPIEEGQNKQEKTKVNKAKQYINYIKSKVECIYQKGYVELYKEQKAQLLLLATIITTILLFSCCGVATYREKKNQDGMQRRQVFIGHMTILLASVIYMIAYVAPLLGLPKLIASTRLCPMINMMLLAVLIIPIDLLLGFLSKLNDKMIPILCGLSVIGCIMIYPLEVKYGLYHSYLYYEMTRYNAAVEQTIKIIKNMPKYKYTVVSVTDELYHVINDGRHEEVLTFVESSKNKTHYTIPTEYIFIYVEKKPLKYVQYHFFTGPEWLGYQEYTKFRKPILSMHPDVIGAEISEEAAEKEIRKLGAPFKSYTDWESRTILQSKLYRWCQKFEERYPNQIDVVYEDDAFMCYMIRQNPMNLYELAIGE